jgi:hypothetical protein
VKKRGQMLSELLFGPRTLGPDWSTLRTTGDYTATRSVRNVVSCTVERAACRRGNGVASVRSLMGASQKRIPQMGGFPHFTDRRQRAILIEWLGEVRLASRLRHCQTEPKGRFPALVTTRF